MLRGLEVEMVRASQTVPSMSSWETIPLSMVNVNVYVDDKTMMIGMIPMQMWALQVRGENGGKGFI